MVSPMSPLIGAMTAAGGLCFGLIRSMELYACWLPRVVSTDSKIAMGYELGNFGCQLRAAHDRLRELTDDPRVLGPRPLEEQFRALLDADGDAGILAAAAKARELVEGLARNYALAIEADPLARALDGPGLILSTRLTGNVFPRPKSVGGASGMTVVYGATLPIPHVATVPSRDEVLEARRGDEPAWADLIVSPAGRAQILHDVFADIELSAMEVCATAIVRFREMPVDFKLDMARQTWDEARHARACLIRSEELGGPAVGRRYSLKVWDRWMAGRDVLECLCIEQLVQEGNALDSVHALAASFAAAGDHRSANLLRFFGRDEELHTAIGNKWVGLAVSDMAGMSYAEQIHSAAERIGMSVPGHAPVAVKARRRGGFPETFLQAITRATVK